MYTPTEKQIEQVNNNFTYHPPKEDQIPRYQDIRQEFHKLATLLIYNCPDSRELSMALSQLTLANMLANAAIAINEKEVNSE